MTGKNRLVSNHNSVGPQNSPVNSANKSGILIAKLFSIPRAGMGGIVVRYRRGSTCVRRPSASRRRIRRWSVVTEESVVRREVSVPGIGEEENRSDIEARKLLVWASIWLASTAGEGGRGRLRAKERDWRGVVGAAEDSDLCHRVSKERVNYGRWFFDASPPPHSYPKTKRKHLRRITLLRPCPNPINPPTRLPPRPRLLLLRPRPANSRHDERLCGAAQRADLSVEGLEFRV